MVFLIVRLEKEKGALEFWKTWKKFLEALYGAKMLSAANLSPDFCETELSTQDFLLPLEQLMHFSSSVTVLECVRQQCSGPELHALVDQAVPCCLPSHKKCHMSQQSLRFTHWSPPQLISFQPLHFFIPSWLPTVSRRAISQTIPCTIKHLSVYIFLSQ